MRGITTEGVAIVRNIKFRLLGASRVHHTLRPISHSPGLWLDSLDRREKMEVAKAELQRALRPIRGSRVEKTDLDALVQKTLGGTKAKTDGAPVPNTTWEYLLRSEILSLVVRLSLSSFPCLFIKS